MDTSKETLKDCEEKEVPDLGEIQDDTTNFSNRDDSLDRNNSAHNDNIDTQHQNAENIEQDKTANGSNKTTHADNKESIQEDTIKGPQSQINGDVNGDVTTAGRDAIKGDKVEVNLKDVQAERATIIGQLNINEEKTDTYELSLSELKPKMLQKVKAVFVSSSEYKEFPHGERIFIVYGPEHAGKFTFAVHVGMELCKNEQNSSAKICIHKRTIRDSLKLIDIIQHQKFNEETVCIIENAFENGIDRTELLIPYLSELNESLEKKKAHLILTTTFHIDNLAELDVEKISAIVEDMPFVLKNHLDYYDRNEDGFYISDKLVELSHKEHERLEEHLKQPFQVDLFCKELSRLPLNENIEKLLEVAQWVGRIDQENPHSWFNDLEPNAELYAMLIVLFDGIDRLIIDDIYIDAVQRLRENGVSNLIDSREIGLNDLLEKIRAQETEVRLLHFNNKVFEEEIRRQIINHHHLLWSLVDMLLDWIDTYKAPEYWEFRKAIGIAIGRLGIYHQNKLQVVLESLAKHEHGGVVAVAGYALDEICRTGEEYSFVTDMLEHWVKSGVPNLMWTAASSVWRIYDGLARAVRTEGENTDVQLAKTLENVLSIFTELAETFDKFNEKVRYEAFNEAMKQAGQIKYDESLTFKQFINELFEISAEVVLHMQKQLEQWATKNLRYILHAIRQVAWTHSKDMVKQIKKWMQTEKNSNLFEVGKMASYQLFHQNSHPKVKLSKERHLPLLDLIKPLLSTDEDTVNMMMRTLLIWIQQSEWANVIHSALLHVINRATSEESAVLRASLSNQWLDNGTIEARRIGQSLIARSYIMEGVPVLMSEHYGVIAIDASYDARMNQAARIGRRLYERLDPQVDMYAVHMGTTKILAKPGQSVSANDLQAEHDRPRLILPPLEELNPSEACFILVITWGSVLDLKDMLNELWTDRLLIASTEGQDDYPKEMTLISVDRHITDYNLQIIESELRKRLAKFTAGLKSEDWWLTLHKYLQVDSNNIEAIVGKLDNWIEQLDSIDNSQHPDVGSVICTILWLASKNLSQCVKIVQTWLTNKNELSRLVGAACGKTLFRVYAHCDPLPSVESFSLLLELVPLLGKQGWNGAEAVLYAAQRWAVQPEWFERLLTRPEGESGELIQLIETVLPEHYDVLSATLDDWGKSLDSEDEENAPAPVIKLTERLQLCVSINMRKTLPDLSEGHSYGLIVLDASDRNNHARNYFSGIASNVIKRLNKRDHETIDLMVYRMGEDYPVAIPGQEPAPEILLPPDLRRPRLLYPLMEIHSIQKVSFILLLTNRSILDQDDWIDSHWNELISLYTQVNDPPWAKPFILIPKQSNPDDAVSVILRHLEQKIGV